MERIMRIIGDYNDYLSQLKEEVLNGGEIKTIFSGELSLLKVIERYNPQNVFYVWDSLDDKGNVILLKVYIKENILKVLEAHCLDLSIQDIAKNLGIKDIDVSTACEWWNLCYFRDSEGVVIYDDYYDRFLSANESDKTMEVFRRELEKEVDRIPSEIDNGIIYVLGNFASYNPFLYELQKKKCQVVPVLPDEIKDSCELFYKLIEIRNKFERPYCNGEVYRFPSSSSVCLSNGSVGCRNPYIITFPSNEIDLNTYVVGNYLLKDILPNGEIRNDYRCFTHDYMLLEVIFYADLFGNTILKSINTTEAHHCVYLNKFCF